MPFLIFPSTVFVSPSVLSEMKKIILESGILKLDDATWPLPDKSGLQELEILVNGQSEHISFSTSKLNSLAQVQESKDPEGLKIFYYLVQDLKNLVFDLTSLHFKVGNSKYNHGNPDRDTGFIFYFLIS